MNILVIGAGGREHALAWKLAQSPRANKVFVAPGNAGTAREPGLENVAIDVEAIEELVAFARDHGVDLTVVGPEAPLVAGVVDAFREAGLAIWGPTRSAAQLEGSKTFSKGFMRRHSIPTARYATFTDVRPALAYVREQGAPIVIKADGLAAGKGVVVAASLEEAEAAITDMLGEGRFGSAGSRVVVEECLEGEEASFICLVDGENVLPMASSQDHKPRDDGDTGPNTGGMGAYSPAPVVTPEVEARIMDQVIRPTVAGMAADGRAYTGFLYAGVMVDGEGQPRVLEFNCRFGDPETQPIMMRLRSDLVELLHAGVEGRLDGQAVDWDPRAALGVVMAAGGYPGSYRKGDVIEGLDAADGPDCKVFHAGTAERGGEVVTSGGRVLCVTGLGETVGEAQQQAYTGVGRIRWQDAYYRSDIGYRAIQREKGE